MPSALDPPADLDAEARAIWVDTLAHIMEAGTLQRLDVHSLSAYVQAVRNHQRASRYLAASDVLLERGGQAIANPALTVQQQAARTIATFAKQFRLTAAAPQAAPGEQPAIEAARPSKDHLGTWCDEHTRWECHAPKTRGRGPCHKLAEPPDGRCSFHGGGDFKVKNLAAKLEREPTYGAPVQTSAEQVLVRRLWARAGHVKWLGERVAELEAAALTWGTDQTVERWWGEFPGSETVHRAGPHVLLDLYERESKALESLAAKIVELGLAARLVDAAQEVGMSSARVVDAILHDLELSAEQWAMVPEVVPRRFRELMPA